MCQVAYFMCQVAYLELPSIGWQLFILGSSPRDQTALPSLLATYTTRLLTEPLRCRSPRGTVGGALQSLDVRKVDPTAKHLHCAQILQVTESPAHSLPLRPDHSAQTLVGVVGGNLDLLIGGNHPFALGQQQQARQTGGHLLEGEIFQLVLVEA